jgi:predicted permease
MRALRVLRDRIRALVGRDVVADEIHEEVQFHLESRIRDLERHGLSRAAARREALRKFGNPSVIEDRGYDVRGGGLMESIVQDVRFGIRLLIKQRGFSFVALTTLALGIGATTAIFCVVDAALIRPLPYDKPEQLVRLDVSERGAPASDRFAASMVHMDGWRQLTHLFSGVGTARSESKTVLAGSEPDRVNVQYVTVDYLPIYGRRPVLGRAFVDADEQLGAPPVALLGYRYWQSVFNGDPAVVGRSLRFSNESATIVGVLNDDDSRIQAKIWMPLQATAERRASRQYGIIARLRDGVSITQAQQALDALPGIDWPDASDSAVFGPVLISEFDSARQYARTTTNVLLGAVAFVLLIACVNVASLQLARGSARHTELAIRTSIGAGRRRLVRQLVTESVLLSVAGAVLGTVLAWLILDTLVANIPLRIPADVRVTLNLRVLAMTGALATASGVVFGLIPAWRSSHTDISSLLARTSRGARTTLSRAAGRSLIAIEVAAAVLLVIGAALMVRTFAHVSAMPLGFDPDRFETMEVAPVNDRPEVFGPYYTALLERVRALPGVVSAGATNRLPLSGGSSFITVRSKSIAKPVVIQLVTPGYFETLGIPLVAGRYPEGRDLDSPRWIVLSQEAAAALFPGESPLGQQVEFGGDWRDVIGVVPKVESRGIDRPLDTAQVYMSASARPLTNFSSTGQTSGQALTIVVHAKSGTDAVAVALRDTAKSIGPAVIVQRIRHGREWWDDSVVTPRQRTVLLGVLGGLGLLLAIVGVFGVTSFSVARRVPEIGVRLAFGAEPRHVVGAVVLDAAVPIFIGLAAGLLAAFFLPGAIATFLYQTTPRDPVAFATAAVLIATGGLVAAWLPARRAAQVDPVQALRAD